MQRFRNLQTAASTTQPTVRSFSSLSITMFLEESAILYTLGPILLIQPYNFPFWLPIKACVPHLLAGDTILLKHAYDAPECASTLEEITREARFQDEFLNMFVESSDC